VVSVEEIRMGEGKKIRRGKEERKEKKLGEQKSM
jgi:hypothetical protein